MINLPLVIQNASTIGACLQLVAGADSLEFAGGEDDAAPLAGILLDFGDGASLFGAAHGVVAGDILGGDAGRQLRTFGLEFLFARFQLVAADEN